MVDQRFHDRKVKIKIILGTATSGSKHKGSNNSWNQCLIACLKSEQVLNRWFIILGWLKKQQNKKCRFCILNLGSYKSMKKSRQEITISINQDNKYGITNHNERMVQWKTTMVKHLMILISSGTARMWNTKEYQISELLIIRSLMSGTQDTVKVSICFGLMPLVIGSLIDAVCCYCYCAFIIINKYNWWGRLWLLLLKKKPHDSCSKSVI